MVTSKSMKNKVQPSYKTKVSSKKELVKNFLCHDVCTKKYKRYEHNVRQKKTVSLRDKTSVVNGKTSVVSEILRYNP